MSQVRLGGVPFRVGAPLLEGLGGLPGVRLVTAAPRRLAGLLREGSLDGALVSSVEAFRHPGYQVAPGLAIACAGPVRSVRAFLAVPPAEVRTVAADAGSATSAALLRILLVRRHGASPQGERALDPATPLAQVPEDAALLIGDAGLAAEAAGRTVMDLGEEWFAWKGLPFVFALWLLRPDAEVPRILPLLAAAAARGRTVPVDDGTGGAVYYRLGPPEREGLMEFRREAVALGLCDPAAEPRFL